ncbi:MAG: STAS domain-containing protein [Candidatus Sulfopaludibacter sp.]|nr:STAS domain-containing protein [Candidatus Sulfopaludibacter sp.]
MHTTPEMQIYLHDRPATFQFVLKGKLMGEWVPHLEHAWDTARSVLAGKELVVDLSGMTGADSGGVELLSRMRESGARLTAAAMRPESEAFLTVLGVSAPRYSAGGGGWAWRFLRLSGLCG